MLVQILAGGRLEAFRYQMVMIACLVHDLMLPVSHIVQPASFLVNHSKLGLYLHC